MVGNLKCYVLSEAPFPSLGKPKVPRKVPCSAAHIFHLSKSTHLTQTKSTYDQLSVDLQIHKSHTTIFRQLKKC